VELIAEAVDALAADDVDGRWLGDELIAMRGFIDRLEAQWSRRLAAFDARGDGKADGHRSTVGWLAGSCRMDARDASAAVHTARALRELSTIKAAWEAGRTTSGHVHRVRRVRHHAKADDLFDQLEATWLELCERHDIDLLSKALAGFVDRLDNTRPDDAGVPPAAADAVARRMLIFSRCLGVGMVEGRFDLADFDMMLDAIDHEVALQHVEGDERTLEQQRADAVMGIFQKYSGNTDPDAECPPVVNVIVELPTLANIEAGLCETDRGTPLPIDTVRRFCCHGEIGRILVGEADEILNLGRTRRLFNRAQRRAMRYRDQGCCFPGCSRSVRQCNPHHIDPWTDGGNTDLDRGCMLCWAHHKLVHEQRWTITRRPDRGIDWYRPNHQHYGTWHPPSRPPPIRTS
jgi:hypothetical protein